MGWENGLINWAVRVAKSSGFSGILTSTQGYVSPILKCSYAGYLQEFLYLSNPNIEMHEALKYSATVKCRAGPGQSDRFAYCTLTQAFSQLLSASIYQKTV